MEEYDLWIIAINNTNKIQRYNKSCFLSVVTLFLQVELRFVIYLYFYKVWFPLDPHL